MQMPTTVLVRRSALRMAAWDMTVNQSISSVWALQPVPPPSRGAPNTGASAAAIAYAEPHWGRWAEAELALQAECLQTIESFEQENGLAPHRRFTTLALMRADHTWMPYAPPITLARLAMQYLRAPSRPPTVLLPDTDDAMGYNDRMAFMSRAAAPAYFRRGVHLTNLRAYHRKIRTTEELLKIALWRERAVRVRRFPTLATLSCCSARRSSCWNRLCMPMCSTEARIHEGPNSLSSAAASQRDAQQPSFVDVLFGRSPRESATALLNANAIRSGRSQIGLASGRHNCTPPVRWLRHFRVRLLHAATSVLGEGGLISARRMGSLLRDNCPICPTHLASPVPVLLDLLTTPSECHLTDCVVSRNDAALRVRLLCVAIRSDGYRALRVSANDAVSVHHCSHPKAGRRRIRG